MPLDLANLEVWVAPHLKDPILQILKNANPKVPWANIIKTKQGIPINDPRELSDADFLSIGGGSKALEDLWEIDKNEAARIARLVLASSVALGTPIRGVSLHILDLFTQSPNGREK